MSLFSVTIIIQYIFLIYETQFMRYILAKYSIYLYPGHKVGLTETPSVLSIFNRVERLKMSMVFKQLSH